MRNAGAAKRAISVPAGRTPYASRGNMVVSSRQSRGRTMEFLLLILFVLLGFFLGTLILGNFFFLVFMKLPQLLGAEPKTPMRTLGHFFLETFGWLLMLVALVFLFRKHLPGHQVLFYCGICVALAFHVGTLARLHGKPHPKRK